MKRICSILLIGCLCQSFVLAQTSATTTIASAGRAVPISATASPFAVPDSQTAATSRSISNENHGSGNKKKLIIAGLGMIGAGTTLNVMSYGSERYNYCPGCRSPLYAYRNTTSSGMYWGGIAVGGAGITFVVVAGRN